MSRLVRSLGMETNEFASGREFVDRIETTPSFQPDCVVLDVQMPGMNGLEVQERLASRGHRLPVIFITAYDEAGVHDLAPGTPIGHGPRNSWRRGNRARDGTVVRSGLLRLCSSQLGKIS